MYIYFKVEWNYYNKMKNILLLLLLLLLFNIIIINIIIIINLTLLAFSCQYGSRPQGF